MSGNRCFYPDFGRFLSVNEMKCFCSAAPYCWCDKQYWFVPDRDTPWDVFLPCLHAYNKTRKSLVNTMLLILDESMSGWRPKTSKLGGLPNYTYEPRKPVPLGTMFRNDAECMSGILVFQDVVQLSEVQSRNFFKNKKSHLPNGAFVPAHTAEVLRQVEGAGVSKGGWVGGASWFVSILSAVEVKVRFGIHSTWVIKQNHDFFPTVAIHSVLSAWHGNRPAGHWLVF